LGISIAVINFILHIGFLVRSQMFFSQNPIVLKVRFNC
jgi:hypothetical protein